MNELPEELRDRRTRENFPYTEEDLLAQFRRQAGNAAWFVTTLCLTNRRTCGYNQGAKK